MARMHSPNRGKSGSNKPLNKEVPEWVSYKSEEVEQLVVKFAKQGKTSAEIGIILRDTYGVPSIKELTGKKTLQIMREKKVTTELPEDVVNLIKKHIAIMKHVADNNHDMTGKRGQQLIESKIKRLVKYYKRRNIISEDWMYDKKKAKLFIE
jgi:small subunit ribosomal protein S15